jgi:hypothetical protein
MMQLALVVVLLLASVGTASAACGWVLWIEREKILAAFTTREQCTAALAMRAEGVEANFKSAPRHTTNLVMSDEGGHAIVTIRYDQDRPNSYSYDCFPDTIDPRGPKAR